MRIFRAVRWQLWLRAIGLADVIDGFLLLIGGNWFNHHPSLGLKVAVLQIEWDPGAKPYGSGG